MNQKRQLQVFIGILVALFLFGSIMLFSYQNIRYGDVFFEYNGFAVHRIEDYEIDEYQVEIYLNNNPQPFIVSSRYNPRDLEDIAVYDGLKDDIIKDELYISMEPTLSGRATVAFSEINKYTENPFLFNLPTFPGLIRDVENNDLPTITCNDVSKTRGVILFDLGDENKIYSDNGCVIIEAITEDDLMRGADRLSLTLLGIMN